MSLFVIRENNTGSYCTGQRHRTFSTVLNNAAVFVSKANATRALRSLFKPHANLVYNNWTTDTGVFYNGDLADYIDYLHTHNDNGRLQGALDFATYQTTELRCDLEVVEVNLVLA